MVFLHSLGDRFPICRSSHICLTKPTVQRHRFSIETKLEMCLRSNQGWSTKKIARQFKGKERTIRGIIKEEERWKKCKLDNADTSKRTMARSPKFRQVDLFVHQWFLDQRGRGSPVTGDELKAKALLFCSKLEEAEGFKASNGWLNKFQIRHKVKEIQLEGDVRKNNSKKPKLETPEVGSSSARFFKCDLVVL